MFVVVSVEVVVSLPDIPVELLPVSDVVAGDADVLPVPMEDEDPGVLPDMPLPEVVPVVLLVPVPVPVEPEVVPVPVAVPVPGAVEPPLTPGLVLEPVVPLLPVEPGVVAELPVARPGPSPPLPEPPPAPPACANAIPVAVARDAAATIKAFTRVLICLLLLVKMKTGARY